MGGRRRLSLLVGIYVHIVRKSFPYPNIHTHKPLISLTDVSILFPRREVCSISSWVSIVYTYVLILRQEMFRQFQNLTLGEAFFSLKMLYLQLGRTDVRILKRSFNFCHYQTYETLFSYILVSLQKNCPHKFRMGFKFWSSWGVAPMIFKISLLNRLFPKMVPNFTDYLGILEA